MKNKTFLCSCVLMILMLLFFACSHTYGEAASAPSYSQDIMELAKNLLASYELFEKGKRLFKKRDYMNAQATFQDALDKDPKNKKAGKYLGLCDKKIAALEKSEKGKEEKGKRIKAKQRERSEWEQQAEIEARRLKDLEKRIRELEAKKDEKPEKEIAIEKTRIEKQPELVTETPVQKSIFTEPENSSTKTDDDKKLLETPLREEEIRKSVIESEYLVEQGNLYFQNQEYEKAYDLYRKALKSLK